MSLAIWILAVLLFNLVWYGRYLSFPLVGEDGAANYSFLLEAVRHGRPFGLTFPIKWLDGLGQPNVFVTVSFDPFSWLMWLPLDPARAFRISFALRATACWFTSFLFATRLFPRSAGVPVTTGWLTMLVSFTLGSWAGIATDVGIPVATHAALFPGLLWLYLRSVEQERWFGMADGVFAAAMILFLLMFPIGSTLGLGALFVFALSSALLARQRRRRQTWVAFAKLSVIGAVVLFTPVLGIYHAWSAVAAVSARQVLASELSSYPRQYVLPHLWHDVPLGIRVVVTLAVALVLLAPAWPRPTRAVGLTLGLVVAASQFLTAARSAGVAADILERLPRPFYFEYYLPVFYAVAAAYVLHRWPRLLSPPPAARVLWPLKVLGIAGTSGFLVGVSTFWWPLRDRWRPWVGWLGRRSWLVPVAVVVALFAGAIATWSTWPEGIHPLFTKLVCRKHHVWCKDPPGRTIGASSNPITEFIAARLAVNPQFQGRADFLLGSAGLDTEPEVGIMVRERNRNFLATGNGMVLHALPVQGIPVATSYEQALDVLYYLFWTRYVNEGATVFRRSINFTALEGLQRERLALAGVRYVIVRDDSHTSLPHMAVAFAWKGYTVYEIADVNVAGYGPTRVTHASSLVEELRIMRAPGFDPRRVAVVNESDRGDLSGGDLAPLDESELRIMRETLVFTGVSSGRALAVLPFRFSHCWQPRWSGRPGRIIRADAALLGVIFEHSARVALTWSAGYGRLIDCLRLDRQLVPQAVAAAAALR